jgi:transcriptional regulator with PAS, ATPase and Fis domain
MKDGGEIPLFLEADWPQGGLPSDRLLVVADPVFRQVLKILDAVSPNDCIVLLEGESGTGKELLARRIHLKSPRRNGPFIPANCPGITDTLFESQFFGHVKGAFTGATMDTLGIVRAANGGTLLLDEVGELPYHVQPKLLRLLQENEITPVGAARPMSVNVRFIASTNRNLAKAVAEGKFRSDLYHRLNIVRIEVPPLRSRPKDIQPLLDYYLAYYAAHYKMPPRELSFRLRRTLQEYPWPGNVRELCAYVERIYATNTPPMPPTFYDWDISQPGEKPIQTPIDRMPLADTVPVGCSLAEAEARAIRNALELTGYNRTAAAKLLKVHRTTLARKLRTFGIER